MEVLVFPTRLPLPLTIFDRRRFSTWNQSRRHQWIFGRHHSNCPLAPLCGAVLEKVDTRAALPFQECEHWATWATFLLDGDGNSHQSLDTRFCLKYHQLSTSTVHFLNKNNGWFTVQAPFVAFLPFAWIFQSTLGVNCWTPWIVQNGKSQPKGSAFFLSRSCWACLLTKDFHRILRIFFVFFLGNPSWSLSRDNVLHDSMRIFAIRINS